MARPLRIQWEGCWYHITSRGNERRIIFLDEEDRLHFLSLLSGMRERFRTRLHVYALMDNHFHLLLETLEANLSRAMQWVNGGYSPPAEDSIGVIGVVGICCRVGSRRSWWKPSVEDWS